MLISNATNSVLLLCGHVYLHFWRSKGRRLDKMQIGLPSKFPGEIKKWLLKVVIALG
ncbi:hypothetical protein HanXRQr2_Chr01g0045621 [Helianthus annuus]|uniref:Uncharacterized protein n=1 Tax=Helianthus annuus TaxID=4232 RepID=A0A9K3P5D9_HELAN|nr:hypothetical protein HanXRQr2_Chr01g0045621 [Helianthus annuus]KAJ0959029.1 hypothetical protein HanPSC8_Chr01g0045371 [Helianthus annuus]